MTEESWTVCRQSLEDRNKNEPIGAPKLSSQIQDELKTLAKKQLMCKQEGIEILSQDEAEKYLTALNKQGKIAVVGGGGTPTEIHCTCAPHVNR